MAPSLGAGGGEISFKGKRDFSFRYFEWGIPGSTSKLHVKTWKDWNPGKSLEESHISHESEWDYF